MGQKTGVFAPYFLPVSQMTSGFGQMKTEKSEDKQMRSLPVLFFIYARFYEQNRRMIGNIRFLYNEFYRSFLCSYSKNCNEERSQYEKVTFVSYTTNSTGLFCVHIQRIVTKKGVNMKTITTEELKNMNHQEGLILQGCGGDLQEWIDGINGILREQGILLDGKPLDDVAVFQHEGLTNLLFAFGEHKLDIGKLAIWRIQTREQFGGTWLSDYMENKLGGFAKRQQAKPDCPLIGEDGNIFNIWRIQTREQFGGTWLSDYMENKLGGFAKRQQAKPDCPLIGEDGNIFNLMGIASRTLKENGMYVEVIAVTANSGSDANTGEQTEESEERELPDTVTLLVTPEQSKILAELSLPLPAKLETAQLCGTLRCSRACIS